MRRFLGGENSTHVSEQKQIAPEPQQEARVQTTLANLISLRGIERALHTLSSACVLRSWGSWHQYRQSQYWSDCARSVMHGRQLPQQR